MSASVDFTAFTIILEQVLLVFSHSEFLYRDESRAAATFKMECFVIIVNGFLILFISSINHSTSFNQPL